MKKFTVALLYNLKRNAPREREDEPWDAWNELDSEKTVGDMERALCAGGHQVIPMEGDGTLPAKLQRYKVDIAFNTCEGHFGASREAQIPALLDMLRVPYTGAGVMTLSLALDKPMTKRILQYHKIPTPAFQTFFTGEERVDSRLRYPLFVKPSREGSGIGVTAKSVCRSARELREQVKFVVESYRQPALVEEFVDGREFTLGILGNVASGPPAARAVRSNGNGRTAKSLEPALRVFPPLEVDLSPCPPEEAGLYTAVIKSKLYNVPKYLCPAPVSKPLRAKMERMAAGAFAALECCDFARIDFRVRAEDGEPYVLEVNPLAGLQEGISDIVMAADADGLPYVGLINGILQAALMRYGMI
ncbi:MAG: hypothetical protein M1482_04680 [Chloroflexi bacterium]|nr:hypothetical protein [Chloroflexota bacterium]